MLKQNYIPVEIYADNADLTLNNVIRNRGCLDADISPDDQLLYFFSTI